VTLKTQELLSILEVENSSNMTVSIAVVIGKRYRR